MIRQKSIYLSSLLILITGLFKPAWGVVVSGTVRDIGNTTVSSALVTFVLASDTTIAFHNRTDQHGNYTINIDENPTHIRENRDTGIPRATTLFQNYPNPFNPVTYISFQIDRDMPVFMVITNILGQTLRVLINKKMNAGTHTVIWDGRNESGREVGAGLYICLMKAGGAVYSHKMILLDGYVIQQGANPSCLKSVSFFHSSVSLNSYNVVITGKGIHPFTMNDIPVTSDTNLYFTVERAPAKHLVLDKSVNLDGGSQGDDAAYGFIFDKNNYMYVTGFVTVSGEGRNIWLAKYDAELNPVDSKTVNGSANGEDTGYTLALDNSGNLFIIGYITETGEDHNIWIAKYDSDLQFKKKITVNGSKNETDDGYGILFDGNGYLYAAGTIREIEGESNIWIAKYDTDLNLIKSITMNRTANYTDKARFMIMDRNGHLFVSGSVSQEISKYDIWIGKFDADLNLLAETDVAGPVAGAEDKGYGICMDEFDILYCTGTLTEPDQGYNIWLAKYDTGLNQIDYITRDGPLHGEDVAYLMAMDDPGYLYITGVYTEPVGNENVWIGIYNRDLQFQNNITVNGLADAYDSGMGIACRPNGIYVSGFLTDVSERGNIWLARYKLSD
jgi:glucuronoarabinoxylan endo-1,4-beta-xylanase